MVAKNGLQESVFFDLEFEIVKKVTGVKINDFQIITVKEQMKEFEISFESFGSGACMLIDFKDGMIKERTQIQRNLHLDSVTNQKADFKVHLGRGYIDLLNRSKDELIFFKN